MTEPGFAVTDVAAYFGGRWELHREITDDAGARLGEFSGRAEFTARPDDLLIYREDGVLELGAHRGPAQRTLHYQVVGPGQAQVWFDYGDFFHELDLRTGHWRTSHPCRQDLYSGEFGIEGPDRWWQCWRVSGPAKAHTLSTRFRRSS